MKKGVAQISDAIIAIGLFLLMLTVIIIPLSNFFIDQSRATVAASHAVRVQKAVIQYIKDNHDVISASATASQPFIFGVPELINAGYLPAGFSPQNGFSATYQTRVFEPAANKLSSMTYLNGGADISKSIARKIAISIGADGGIIDNGVAVGALGSWTMSLSTFGGYNPGEGHVVIAGFYSDGLKVSDYLYRKAVPGHPELNTMNTNLNMGGNNIENGGTTTTINLNATNVNSQTTRTRGETYTGGWFRTTGDTGWYNEKWGGGFTMTDSTYIRAYNDKSIYTGGTVLGGTVRGGTVRSDGNASVGGEIELDSVRVAGTACPKNGNLSRDALGAILSCQSGRWETSRSKLIKSTMSNTVFGGTSPVVSATHDYCALTYTYYQKSNGQFCKLVESPLNSRNWVLTADDAQCEAVCFDSQ